MRRGEYGIALYFPDTVTMGRMYELLDGLDEHDISVDYATFEFQKDGLYCEAVHDECENIEQLINDIGQGDMVLDWDTMADWYEGTE